MAAQAVATKGNLIKARKSLGLAQNGFELMDRKRNILIREMMSQVEKVKILREQITSAYQTGYYLLQQANMSSGMITAITEHIKVDDSIKLTYRSVMGIEVPYGLEGTSSRIDEAYIQFQKVKQITLVLAEVDNSIYRLANAISKTQKRANALKNVVIPRYQSSIKEMTESLEEKEREEFSRMKVIKAQKEN